MWYIISNGQQVGPMPMQDLVNYNLQPDSMVWKQGMPDWTRAGNVPELQSLFNEGFGYGQQPHYCNPQQPMYGSQSQRGSYDQYGRYIPLTDKSKTTFGILALLLGALGIQYFYVGKTGGGLLTILLTLITCGCWEIITFIQGIVVLCMSDSDFERKFVLSKSTFPLF